MGSRTGFRRLYKYEIVRGTLYVIASYYHSLRQSFTTCSKSESRRMLKYGEEIKPITTNSRISE